MLFVPSLQPSGEQTGIQTLKMQFLGAFLHHTPLLRKKGERCELHQAMPSQSEPLIITSQYQLQQPCADAKTLRGLATLPYLI